MKKIVVASLFAAAFAVGCSKPSDQACAAAAECAGKDPAEECEAEELDEEEQKCADACDSQTQDYSQCVLDNAKCEDEVYTLDPADACDDQLKALGECGEENC